MLRLPALMEIEMARDFAEKPMSVPACGEDEGPK